jgi:hypothetical protein
MLMLTPFLRLISECPMLATRYSLPATRYSLLPAARWADPLTWFNFEPRSEYGR